MNSIKLFLGALAIAAMIAVEVDAQRFGGGGGGGRGGGGASRGGGHSAPSMNRSPSSGSRSTSNRSTQTNRSPQQANRSGQAGSRAPQSGQRPSNANRSTSPSRGNAAAKAGNTPRGGEAVSRNQLDSFLGTSGNKSQSRSGNESNRNSGSWQGDNVQVDWAGGRGGGTTGSGTNYGGAGGAVKVTGKDGNSKVIARGGGAATNGDKAVAGRGRVEGTQRADGTASVTGRGGVAGTDGQNSAVKRGAGGAARAADGTTAGRAVGGVRATDGTNTVGRAGAAGVVKGPGGNVYGRGVGATTYNGIVRGAGQVNAVRGNWNGYGWYGTPGWYAKYPNAWRAAAITTTAWFVGATWRNVCNYYPYQEPISYDYGDEIRYEGDTVYSGDEEIGTADEYYQEAAAIADVSDTASNDDDWMPLGVFAIVTEGQEKSDKTLQLAINRDGVVRGNYSDGLSEDVKQVEGGLDQETQRVAITFVDNREVVAEMGLYNLTEDVLTMLVHKGPNTTEQRGLVRLKEEDSQ